MAHRVLHVTDADAGDQPGSAEGAAQPVRADRPGDAGGAGDPGERAACSRPVHPPPRGSTEAALPGVSGGVGERVVLVRDRPPTVLLAQPEREPQAVLWVRGEILRRAATEQRPGVRDVRARGDVQRHDLERRAAGLPLEEPGQMSR